MERAAPRAEATEFAARQKETPKTAGAALAKLLTSGGGACDDLEIVEGGGKVPPLAASPPPHGRCARASRDCEMLTPRVPRPPPCRCRR